MSDDFTHRVVTTRRHEYTLSTPSTVTDLQTVIEIAASDAKATLSFGTSADLSVRSHEGAIVIHWSEDETTS